MKCYTMRKVLIKSKSIMRRDHEELIPVFQNFKNLFIMGISNVLRSGKNNAMISMYSVTQPKCYHYFANF